MSLSCDHGSVRTKALGKLFRAEFVHPHHGVIGFRELPPFDAHFIHISPTPASIQLSSPQFLQLLCNFNHSQTTHRPLSTVGDIASTPRLDHRTHFPRRLQYSTLF